MEAQMKSCIANLFVVGVARAGTTSLCYGLAQHPEIYFPREKEPHYFLFRFDGGGSGLNMGVSTEGPPLERTRFISNFKKYQRMFGPGESKRFRGDGSTQYFVSDIAAKKIAGVVKYAKIIIQLREPLARAWSAYCYAVSKGDEVKTFRTALEEELNGHRDNRFYGGYLNTSVYGRHVFRYIDIFGSENVNITFFEDFKDDPQDVFDYLFDTLGVAPFKFTKSSAVLNPTVILKNPMLRAIRKAGSSIHARHGWISNLPYMRSLHTAILRWGSRPDIEPSTDDAAYFRELLWEASKAKPLESIIGSHPYTCV